MKLKHILFSLYFIMSVSLLLSQEKSQINELTLNTAYFTHNITFPFTSLSFQNSGIDINMEMIRNRNRTVSLLYNSSFSWYYHDQFANAFLLDFAIGCRIKPGSSGFFFNSDIGLGYQLSLAPVYMYELNENGEYVRDKFVSRSSIIIPVSVKLGYIFQKMKYPVSIFVKYKWFVQAPYIDEAPIVPHGSLHFGLGIRLKSISKNKNVTKTN
jgi:hypothetical protein